MYLSRIPLDITKRKTQIALVSPNKFHGAIEEAFLNKQDRNLWRIDTLREQTYLLLLSSEKPDLAYIAGQFGKINDCGETKEYDTLLNRVKEGSIWHFRLVANPTHSVKDKGSRGRITAHTVERFQLEWLQSQSEKRGFRLIPNTVCVMESKWRIFNKKNANQKVRLLEVTYEGNLQVVEIDLFKNTLVNGIGRGKAYGMGLLTIAGERI